MGAASSVTSRPSSTMTNHEIEELTLTDLPVDMVILETVPSDGAPSSAGEVRIVPRAPRRAALPAPSISPISERDDSLSRSVPASAQTARTVSSSGVKHAILRTSASRSSASETKRRVSGRQLASLKQALSELKEHFDVSFDHDRALGEASKLELGPNEEVLKLGGKALGLCVVDAGFLQVTDREGRTVLGHLHGQEMFGELSTLFDIPCSASVRVGPDQG